MGDALSCVYPRVSASVRCLFPSSFALHTRADGFPDSALEAPLDFCLADATDACSSRH